MAWDLAGVAIDSAGVIGGTELTAVRCAGSAVLAC